MRKHVTDNQCRNRNKAEKESANKMSRSSRGLGHRPFTAVTGVRLPYGTPHSKTRNKYLVAGFFMPAIK